MKRKPTSILLWGLTLLTSGLNLCGQALAQEVDKDSSRIPLVGYNEHRTNLPGGRHVNVSTNRAMVAKADGTERRSIGISEQSHDSWRLLEAAVNWSVEIAVPLAVVVDDAGIWPNH